MINNAFNQQNYRYLIGSCDAPHLVSRKVMERLGMIKEAELNKNGLATVFYKLQNE